MRIGVDLGGTKIEALALEDAGRELRRVRVETPQQDYQATVAAVRRLVLDLERAAGREGTVGVGIPGTIVAATGLVKNANSTWLNGQPLERDLSEALGREVRCANDANCFAISEATDGAAVGAEVVFGVILGTGCGGGVVVRGRIHAGPNGLAGEWGHTPLPWPSAEEYPGPACYCGRRGCLETWISGPAFERDFAKASGRVMRAAEVAAAAEQGDAEAEAALARLEERLARGLATVVNVLDPDAIVLGGGLSRIDRLYAGGVTERLRGYGFGGGGFGGGVETPLLRNVHGDSSGVRGAAWLWPAERGARA
ncbi:MAG TPA: ROK family protein [Acidobacteriaceae bacterium]|jgi:fructokinase|nr:ROK family protein [Acidobacteriaceae bacterium]